GQYGYRTGQAGEGSGGGDGVPPGNRPANEAGGRLPPGTQVPPGAGQQLQRPWFSAGTPAAVSGGGGGLPPGPGPEGKTGAGSRRRTQVSPGGRPHPLEHGPVAAKTGNLCGVREGLPPGLEHPARATGQGAGYGQGPPDACQQLRRTGHRARGAQEGGGG